MWKSSTTLFLLLALFCHNVISQTIQLPDGKILGREAVSYTGTPYYIFQKIPYAKPPVDTLRFRDPEPPEPWTGILNTTYLDKICYQVTVDLPEESEDCLYINVYTPELPSDTKNVSRPVLLYIYGGGFTEGHAMTYRRGPEFLIDYDVVIVTFNYRLGPFGFLSTEDSVISGNQGLKDQQLAIKWVKNNINLFGGDSEKITIVGESAGGVSVSYQLLNTDNEGLFRGAIMESGTAINTFALQRDAKDRAFAFGSLFNPIFNDTDEQNDTITLRIYLQTQSAESLDKASTQISGWAPVIESSHSPGAFITKKMYELIKYGYFVQVPIMLGINSEEALAFDGNSAFLTEKMKFYDNDPTQLVPEDTRITDPEGKKDFGEKIKKAYVGDDLFANHLGAGVRFDSDNMFTRSIIKAAELYSKFTDVHFYQFSYDGVMGNGTASYEGAERVGHAEELRYVWRTTRDGYDNSDLSKFPEEDVNTLHRMCTLWTNFVKYLNPTPEAVDLLQNVTWPAVTSGEEGDFLYLDIDKDLTVKSHPKADTYAAWVALYDTLGFDNFDTY